MSTGNPQRDAFAAQKDTFSLLNPPRTTPYAMGERGSNSRLRVIPLFSGVDAFDSLQDYYTPRIQDSKLGLKIAEEFSEWQKTAANPLVELLEGTKRLLKHGPPHPSPSHWREAHLGGAKAPAPAPAHTTMPPASSSPVPGTAASPTAGKPSILGDFDAWWQHQLGKAPKAEPAGPAGPAGPAAPRLTSDMQDLVDATKRSNPPPVPPTSPTPPMPPPTGGGAGPVPPSPSPTGGGTAPAAGGSRLGQIWNRLKQPVPGLGWVDSALNRLPGKKLTALGAAGVAGAAAPFVGDQIGSANANELLKQTVHGGNAPHVPAPGPLANSIANAPATVVNWVKNNIPAATAIGGGVTLAGLLAYYMWNRNRKKDEDQVQFKFAGLDMQKVTDSDFVLGFLVQCAEWDNDETEVHEKIARACTNDFVREEFEKAAFGGAGGAWDPTRNYAAAPHKPPMPSHQRAPGVAPQAIAPGQATNLSALRSQSQQPGASLSARQQAQAAARPDHPYWSNFDQSGQYANKGFPRQYGPVRTGKGFGEDWKRVSESYTPETQTALQELMRQTKLPSEAVGRALLAQEYLRGKLPYLDSNRLDKAMASYSNPPPGSPPSNEPAPRRPDLSEVYRNYYSLPPEYRDSLTQYQAGQINNWNRDVGGPNEINRRGGPQLSQSAAYQDVPSIGGGSNQPGDWIFPPRPDRAHEAFNAEGQPQLLDPEAYVNLPEYASRYNVDLSNQDFRDWWKNQQGEGGTGLNDPAALVRGYWHSRNQRELQSQEADQAQNRWRDHGWGFRRFDPRTDQEVTTTDPELGTNREGNWGAFKDFLGTAAVPAHLWDPDSRAAATRGFLSPLNQFWGTDLGYNLKPDARVDLLRENPEVNAGQSIPTTPALLGDMYDPLTGTYKPSFSNQSAMVRGHQADNPDSDPLSRIAARGGQAVNAKGPDLAAQLAIQRGMGFGGAGAVPQLTHAALYSPLYRNAIDQADPTLTMGERGQTALKGTLENLFLPVQANPAWAGLEQGVQEWAPARNLFSDMPDSWLANTTYNPEANNVAGTGGALAASAMRSIPYLVGDKLRGHAGAGLAGGGKALASRFGSNPFLRAMQSAGAEQQVLGRVQGRDIGLSSLPAVGDLLQAGSMTDAQQREHADMLRNKVETPYLDRLRKAQLGAASEGVIGDWQNGLPVDQARLDHFKKLIPPDNQAEFQQLLSMSPERRQAYLNGQEQGVDREGAGPTMQSPQMQLDSSGIDRNVVMSALRAMSPEQLTQFNQQASQLAQQAQQALAKRHGGPPEQYAEAAQQLAQQEMLRRISGGREKQNAAIPSAPAPVNDFQFSTSQLDQFQPGPAPPPAAPPQSQPVQQPAVPQPAAKNPMQPIPPPPKAPAVPAANVPQPSVQKPPTTSGVPQPSVQKTPAAQPAQAATPEAGAAGGSPQQPEQNLLQQGISSIDELMGGRISTFLQAPPEQQAEVKQQIESVVSNSEQLPAAAESLAKGELPAPQEEIDAAAHTRIKEETGADDQSIFGMLGNMDTTQKVLLWGGLGLGAVGLISALTSEEGGILPWLLGILGIGGAAFGAANAGLLGEGAQQFTQPIRQGGESLAGGVADQFQSLTGMRGDQQKIPAFVANTIHGAPDDRLPEMIGGLSKFNPEIATQLDRAVGHGDWGNSVLSYLGDVTGQTNQSFQDAGLQEADIPRVMDAWRKWRTM